MNAREELGRKLGRELANNRENLPEQGRQSQAILDEYAIGRWVSVEERMPSGFVDGRWKGCLKNEDSIHFGVFHYKEFMPGYEWLDLSLPRGKGEA